MLKSATSHSALPKGGAGSYGTRALGAQAIPPKRGVRAHGRHGAQAPVGRCLRARETARPRGTEMFPRARVTGGVPGDVHVGA